MQDYFELLNAETFEDYLKLVNIEVHQNISKCQTIAKDYQRVRIENEKERHKAFMKLHLANKEYYQRRRELVNGADPKDNELEGYQTNTECPPNEQSTYQNGIPCFWLHVLTNSKIFGFFEGTELDSLILVHLNDISVDYFDVEETTLKDGTASLLYTYHIHFDFNENEYLRTPRITLKVTYKLGDVENEMEEPKVECLTQIEWVKGKDPRYKIKGKKSHGKVGSIEKIDSFFDIFYPAQLAIDNEINDDGTVDPEAMSLHDIVERMIFLITEVIPAAVNYFDETLIEDDEDVDMDDDMIHNVGIDESEMNKAAADDGQQAQKQCENQ